MTRFIMHWTLSPRWNDGWGPPGKGFTGVHHAQNGTKIRAATNSKKLVFGNPSTQRSIGLSSLCMGIVLPPFEGASAAHFARNLIGAKAGLENGIVGGFDAGRETVGIEADALPVLILVLGDLDQGERTHGDPKACPRPRFRGIVERITFFADG